jgi:hypothetical protein
VVEGFHVAVYNHIAVLDPDAAMYATLPLARLRFVISPKLPPLVVHAFLWRGMYYPGRKNSAKRD